jgi:hypothetical protein
VVGGLVQKRVKGHFPHYCIPASNTPRVTRPVHPRLLAQSGTPPTRTRPCIYLQTITKINVGNDPTLTAKLLPSKQHR